MSQQKEHWALRVASVLMPTAYHLHKLQQHEIKYERMVVDQSRDAFIRMARPK